jgi:hypothetical protein
VHRCHSPSQCFYNLVCNVDSGDYDSIEDTYSNCNQRLQDKWDEYIHSNHDLFRLFLHSIILSFCYRPNHYLPWYFSTNIIPKSRSDMERIQRTTAYWVHEQVSRRDATHYLLLACMLLVRTVSRSWGKWNTQWQSSLLYYWHTHQLHSPLVFSWDHLARIFRID